MTLDLELTADLKLIGERDGDAYGIFGDHISVAGAGDVNADGYQDLLVGLAGNAALGDTQAGATYLVQGPLTGELDLSLADARLLGSESEYSGQDISGASDVDGDGYADIVVGAPLFGYPEDTEGQAYLVLGPVTGDLPLSGADAFLHGELYDYGDDSSYTYTGQSVSMAGDTDGDGNADVLVGARGYGAGAAYLVLGPVSGTVELSEADVRIVCDTWGLLGYGVASAGDTNGDGLDDILIGQPLNLDAAVYLFVGPVSSDATPSSADALFLGLVDSPAGGSPRSAGDTDGDGFADVLINVPSDDTAGDYAGVVYLYPGPLSGEVGASDVGATLLGAVEYGNAGLGMDSAGDVDNDGFADFAIGAPEIGFKGGGTTWLFYGPVSGTVSLSTADVQIVGEGDDRSGYAVAGAGDVDADGLDDLLIGGPGDDDGGTEDAGAAWLVLASSMR